jgi:hypothetical protein
VLSAAFVLTILVAVATVLIAPQVDMPDTVLRLHHVSSHSAGTHGLSSVSDTGIAVLAEAPQSDDASRSSDNLNPQDGLHARLSVVMRC